jgi:hypothetical protein
LPEDIPLGFVQIILTLLASDLPSGRELWSETSYSGVLVVLYQLPEDVTGLVQIILTQLASALSTLGKRTVE